MYVEHQEGENEWFTNVISQLSKSEWGNLELTAKQRQ
jgi:hypothetical protein